MARLPTPGSDSGAWGDLLNEFLLVEHDASGNLKNVARPGDGATIADGSITSNKLASAVQTSLTKADNAIPASQKGAANGVASLDSGSKLTVAQLPASVALTTGQAGDIGKAIDASTGSPLVVNNQSIVVYDGSWPASRPVTAYPILAIGPTQPSWLANGDAFVDTDDTAASSGGSFEQSIGICRTFADPETITNTGAVTANRINYMRIKGNCLGSTGAAIAVATTSTGNMGLAVYSNSGSGEGAVPGARKCTTGSVTVPAVGMVKLNWLEGATDVVEGDWLGFVCDDATTARFYRNATLYPRTEMVTGLNLAQSGSSAVPPSTAASTFGNQAVFYGKIT